MPTGRMAQREPGTADQPTTAAQLKISAVRMNLEVGNVPPADARFLITSIGIVGSVGTSITGVILTLRAAAALPPRDAWALALAELMLGLAGAVLTAICSRRRRGPEPSPADDSPGTPPAGEQRRSTRTQPDR